MLHGQFHGILLAYGVFLVGIFSPGPNILSILGTSMSQGRKAGRSLALGISVGSLIWGTLTLVGLSALLASYASALFVIKIVGAIYLLWLAFKAFRSALRPQEMPIVETPAGTLRNASLFRAGLLIQLTNPKAALTWVAGMSFALGHDAPIWAGAVVVGGTAIISMLAHLIYAQAFSAAPMIRLYSRTRRWIEAGLGVFFCFASYKVITSRTS